MCIKLANEIEDQKQEMEKFQVELNQMTTKLRNQVNEKEELTLFIKQTQNSEQGQNKQVQQQINILQTDIETLKTQLDLFEQERKTILEEQQYLTKELDNYYNKYQTIQTQYKEETNYYQSELSNLNQNFNIQKQIYEEKISHYEQEINNLHVQLERHKENVEDNFQVEVRDLQSQIANYVQKYHQQLEQYNELKKSYVSNP